MDKQSIIAQLQLARELLNQAEAAIVEVELFVHETSDPALTFLDHDAFGALRDHVADLEQALS